MLKKSNTRPMCEYYNECKKINNYLQKLYVGIVMDVKNQQLFTRPICEYCIFEMTLWKL